MKSNSNSMANGRKLYRHPALQGGIHRASPTFAKFFALILFGCLFGSAQAADLGKRVEVIFVNPDQYTDVADRPGASLRGTLDELRRYLNERGAAHMAPGERLTLMISNIDRAGGFEPVQGAEFSNTRIIRALYPPRIELHFRLSNAEGKVWKEGTRNLSDPAFLDRPLPPSDDPLRYEKRLIEEWLAREIEVPSGK